MKRVLTAVVLVPAVVALIWWGPGELLLLVVVGVSWLSLWEYLELVNRMGYAPTRVPLYFGGLVLCFLGLLQPAHLLAGLIGVALLALCVETFRRQSPTEVLPSVATSVLGLLYVVLPLSFLLALHQRFEGPKLVLYVLLLTWVGDTAAYYVGRALGQHKLAPRLSPGKTVAGSVASLVTSVAVGHWLLREWFPQFAQVHTLLLPVVLNLASQTGDLAESALKRGAGVKDSSQLLPGHGGVLDRIDGLLLALPTLWYYYILVLGA